MLYQISVNCKNYSELIVGGFRGGQASKDEFRCDNPGCRCGMFYRHGFYGRHILHFDPDPDPDDTIVFMLPDGTPCVDTRIKMLRVQCAGCGITHAIAPVDMIPFQVFSLSAFLSIVLYLLSNGTHSGSGHKHTAIHAVDGLSWHVQKKILRICREYHSRMMAALRLQGLYGKSHDLDDISLARVYLGLSPPSGAPLAFLRCHKQPVFVNRRSTVSYPLRFLLPEAL